jgi:hypothetical protein
VRLCVAGSPGCAAEHGGVTVVPLVSDSVDGGAESLLRLAAPGDHVCFHDSAGSHRRLIVVEAASAAAAAASTGSTPDSSLSVLCTSFQSAYITAGLTMHLHTSSSGSSKLGSDMTHAAGKQHQHDGKHHHGSSHHHHSHSHATGSNSDDDDGDAYAIATPGTPPPDVAAAASARVATLPAAPGSLLLTTGDVVRIESGGHAGYMVAPASAAAGGDARLAGIAAVITVDIPEVFASVR